MADAVLAFSRQVPQYPNAVAGGLLCFTAHFGGNGAACATPRDQCVYLCDVCALREREEEEEEEEVHGAGAGSE